MSTRGCFIVIEGPDGSGKTCLSKKLHEILNNTVLVKAPSGILRDIISESYGKISMRAWHFLWITEMINNWDINIKPALNAGKNVICDRWTWISRPVYAHYVMEQPLGGIIQTLEYILTIHEIRKPEVVFLLDTPLNIIEERLSSRDGKYLEMFEKENILSKVREGYLNISKNLRGTHFKKILTHKKKEDVLKDILKELRTEGLYIER